MKLWNEALIVNGVWPGNDLPGPIVGAKCFCIERRGYVFPVGVMINGVFLLNCSPP
jgi:hypothetical protein